MADLHSFDIGSDIDNQEIDNAVNQSLKELHNRYDLKDSKSEIAFKPAETKLDLESADDYKVKAVWEILKQRLIKRNLPLKAFSEEKIEVIGGGRAKLIVKIQQGLSKEQAKDVIKDIKESGMKVQSQIQEDQIRVTSKKIDDLQSVMNILRGKNYSFNIQFLNYR